MQALIFEANINIHLMRQGGNFYVVREHMVYPMIISVQCSQLWISSGVLSLQYSLSNLVIYLFSLGGETPPCCNGTLGTKHTEGLRARAHEYVQTYTFCEYCKSYYFPASVKGGFWGGGGGQIISRPCVRPIVGNIQLPIPGVLREVL